MSGMTEEQKAARAHAIAKSKADDRFARAVQKSSWKTMGRYATERLGKSPGMLTHYRQGANPVPDDVRDKIWDDFKLRIGRSS